MSQLFSRNFIDAQFFDEKFDNFNNSEIFRKISIILGHTLLEDHKK
jgi:hypothetical protein